MSTTVSAALFQNLIQLVSSNYNINSSNNLKDFQEGVTLFTTYIFKQDLLVDNEIDWVSQYTSQQNILNEISFSHRMGIQKLSKVFNFDHQFWTYLTQEESLYNNFITKEKYQNITKAEITLANFEEMAFAKHALALVPLKGLDWLFESKKTYEEVKNMFTSIFCGIQMMDDIDDFSKDLESGQWNFIQFQVQKIIKDENLINDGSLDKFEERVFYASGICKESSEYVLLQYENAEKLAQKLEFQDLQIWLSQMILEIKDSIAFVESMAS